MTKCKPANAIKCDRDSVKCDAGMRVFQILRKIVQTILRPTYAGNDTAMHRAFSNVYSGYPREYLKKKKQLKNRRPENPIQQVYWVATPYFAG